MDSRFDEANSRLGQLDTVRDRFIVRAERLPADLAVLWLCNEIREAAYSAVELRRLHAQSAAFPSARTVFEATQQLIVLATEDDYVGIGTRAWLYHRRKEKRIAQFARGTQAADEWYAEVIREIQQIWVVYNSGAETILQRKNARSRIRAGNLTPGVIRLDRPGCCRRNFRQHQDLISVASRSPTIMELTGFDSDAVRLSK